jgi:tetratricopeptide (TPR) repeat protein
MKNQMEILIKANQARLEKRFEDARQLYMNYLDNHSDDADVMSILAQVMYELAFRNTDRMSTFLKEAIGWVERAIVLKPNQAEFYVILGKILITGVDIPDYEQAADHFRKALELNPTLYNAGLGLALLARIPESLVSYSEAIAAMERIAKAHPDNQHVFMSLGYLYESAKRSTEAQNMFKRALLCSEPLATHYVEAIATPRHVQIEIGGNK